MGGYLGALFVAAYSQVRVLGPSGIVDRQSERLYIHTINMSGFMNIHSCYIPFLLKNDRPDIGKPAIYLPTLNNYPLTEASTGEHQGPELYQMTELNGV